MSLEKELLQYSLEEKLKLIKYADIRETFLKFATQYHRNTRGEKMRFDTFLHMVELYDEAIMAKDVVIMGGTQIGKTDWLIIYILAAAYCGLNVFYVLPHNKMRDKYVQEKILKPISMSSEYKLIKKDSVADSVEQMQFGKGIIRFVSANIRSEMTSFSADIVVIDELDQVDKNSMGNIEIGFGRLDGSSHQFKRIVSNPNELSTPDLSYIDSWYEKSDKRVRKCPCDSCGEFFEISWFKHVVEEVLDEEGDPIELNLRDSEWFPGCNRDVRVKCECGGNINRFSEEAYWEATAFSEEGIVGYHMPSYVSHSVRISQMWFEFKDARDSPSKMSAFYSKRLALPFSKTGHRISANVFNRCVDENVVFTLETDCAYRVYDFYDINRDKQDFEKLWSVMGIDVSPTHLDISTASIHGHLQKIEFIGKIDPNMFHVLLSLVDRYNVKVACIDIGPEKLFSEKFQEEADCDVWMVKYKGVGEDRSDVQNFEQMVYTIDQTQALDKAYTSYKTLKTILPSNYEEILGGVFFQEMKSLSRNFTEDSSGKVRMKWEGPKENHSRHSDSYRNLAYEISIENVLDASCITIG